MNILLLKLHRKRFKAWIPFQIELMCQITPKINIGFNTVLHRTSGILLFRYSLYISVFKHIVYEEGGPCIKKLQLTLHS